MRIRNFFNRIKVNIWPSPNQISTHTRGYARGIWRGVCKINGKRWWEQSEWAKEWWDKQRIVFYLRSLLAVWCVFFLGVWVFYFSQLDSGSKQLTLSLRLSLSSISHFLDSTLWMNEWMNSFRNEESHIGTTNDRKSQLHNRERTNSCSDGFNSKKSQIFQQYCSLLIKYCINHLSNERD